MAIKEIPISIKQYYKKLIADITKLRETNNNTLQEYIIKIEELHKVIEDNKDILKSKFNFDVENYEEFNKNSYSTGQFLKAAKGLLLNKTNNYELISDCYDVYNLADTHKKIEDLKKDIALQDAILKLNLKKYTELVRNFYIEVHKHLVLNGEGYAYEGNIGWICINRCVIKKARPHINFAATKARERELKNAGIKIYNKEEAEWCKRNGIEYKAEDKRVYKKDEYCYEVPLLDCKLKNATKLKFTTTDYRHSSIRGKSNEDLIKECNNNTNAICELFIDLKTKIVLCDNVDKILYTKFIRNENQEPSSATKANRKNR